MGGEVLRFEEIVKADSDEAKELLGFHENALLQRSNRPFLRCMNGFGLCLWRLGRFEEAQKIFKRTLWLNPSDNQGVRFLIDGVRAGVQWEHCS